MGKIYITFSLIFTVYGQIILKWRMNLRGSMPSPLIEKLYFFAYTFLDPWIISSYVSALFASVFWMATMTKLDLSYAYPFMSLAFVLVLLFSSFFFNEPINSYKVVGLFLIILGIIVSGGG